MRARDGGLVLMVLGLMSCSPASPDREHEHEESVTVEGASGAVTVPRTDTGIWALDEITGLHLLSLDVTPTRSALPIDLGDAVSEAGVEILEDGGVEMVDPSRPELVAEVEPSLIIGVNHPEHQELLPHLERIAPVLLVEDNDAWDEQLAVLGSVTGHEDEANTVTERIEREVDALSDRIAASSHAGTSVSLLSTCGDQVCVYGGARAAGSLLDQLGLSRPEAQESVGNTWGFTQVSAEALPDHSADVVLSLVGSIGATSVTDHVLLDTTDSVTADVDFGAWYGSGPLHLTWMLRDLDSVLFGDGVTTDVADAARLWRVVRGAE
ncbi:ABC transporter substrate-binding protein [Spiractinospora alimapuensis]|uniref:ABC transporter substrate-binding protein n=1 Tax=Spiractinospora alimapuensis TaxID=2820884 RepID=UPI001F22B676|nr:ABC transporter substrate-binding protein [Spiractinospora alimapuensis]QVQ52905.1 ABC transporter substrate-binding protein [Spiractinospora alimapuensis]